MSQPYRTVTLPFQLCHAACALSRELAHMQRDTIGRVVSLSRCHAACALSRELLVLIVSQIFLRYFYNLAVSIESETLLGRFQNPHVIPIIKKGLQMYFILLKSLLPRRAIDFAFLLRWAIHFGLLPRWAVDPFWLDQLSS